MPYKAVSIVFPIVFPEAQSPGFLPFKAQDSMAEQYNADCEPVSTIACAHFHAIPPLMGVKVPG